MEQRTLADVLVTRAGLIRDLVQAIDKESPGFAASSVDLDLDRWNRVVDGAIAVIKALQDSLEGQPFVDVAMALILVLGIVTDVMETVWEEQRSKELN